ncbi:hypothetical protein BS78_05G077400 [Paspalum vaginatum]|nr:hypothetical protein BS78_05G077400 [Paspalum vaginatum]
MVRAAVSVASARNPQLMKQHRNKAVVNGKIYYDYCYCLRVVTPNSKHSSARKRLQLAESEDVAADDNRCQEKGVACQEAIMNKSVSTEKINAPDGDGGALLLDSD